MIIAFDIGWDFTLLNKEEGGGANVCHGDHLGSHVVAHTGGFTQHAILLVARVVQACRDLTAEDRVSELTTGVDVRSRSVADDGLGLFGGG